MFPAEIHPYICPVWTIAELRPKHRWMASDRRENIRRQLFLECSWIRGARLTDLSLTGCYVDCRRVPPLGDEVEFDVDLDGASITLRGKVVHAKEDVGFAMAFTTLPDTAMTAVRAFLAQQGTA